MPSYKPETPLLTVDVIVELNELPDLPVVFIERKNPPPGFALPGGFVDIGETVAQAARREAKEEISLDVELTQLLGVYSAPQRDPRGHTVSVVFIGRANGEPVAADDASRIVIQNPYQPPSPLAFDHGDILQDYLRFKESRARPPLDR